MGHCYEPALKLSNNQKMFFPPIFRGLSTTQALQVKNQSRVPVQYEWKVPEKYRDEIKFSPAKALLQPNQEVSVETTFTAVKKKNYYINVPIYVWSIYDHLRNSVGYFHPGSEVSLKAQAADIKTRNMLMKKYTLEVIGRGSEGAVQIEPKSLDFGTITVGFSKTMQATIYNRSNCNIYIELKMMPKVDSQTRSSQAKKELSTINKVLKENFLFDTPKGIINAKSKKTLSISFNP